MEGGVIWDAWASENILSSWNQYYGFIDNFIFLELHIINVFLGYKKWVWRTIVSFPSWLNQFDDFLWFLVEPPYAAE